jgi:hypothetical protein
MTSFNETIAAVHIQAGAGTASTTPSKLVNVLDRPARKGVKIKNEDATDVIYVGGSNVSSSLGYKLGEGESVELEIKDVDNIWIVASANTPAYSWIAY